MKDLKLPIMSDEAKQKAWNNLKPNDKLACIEHCGIGLDDYYIKYFTIVKKTPKGNIRLDNGELLKSLYSDYYIVTDELLECINKIQLEESVMSLLHEVGRNKRGFKSNLEYKDAIKLKDLLEKILNK
ncbi:hypothetical protein EXN00_16660 [Clostridium botulinum]|uniref:hypothetical protein n=1 Tax=Clostridium botulinum TaxID=1491 RepID=UPI0007742FAD|nr:hypothetical protein [Clostridium botulinum]MBN3365639.1 hypothetical protein [Clostridium botulinum]MBN3368353.1 hypothetical protein [Clostridium botulinum]MBN3375891.1 hypothetical protein [Clostridium botulinum]MBN3392329.1 hypothetical protein [Clostridium botulinum]MBN3403635.1 hypothetical protein [Clostridium botulinum]